MNWTHVTKSLPPESHEGNIILWTKNGKVMVVANRSVDRWLIDKYAITHWMIPTAPDGKVKDDRGEYLVGLIKNLLPMARDSYQRSYKAGAHLDMLEDDRAIIYKAEAEIEFQKKIS